MPQGNEVRNSKAAAHWISGRSGANSAAIFALLTTAIVFGGGGVRYGLMNAVVQISALAILAFKPSRLRDFFLRGPMALRILTALTILLPFLQLLPLPPSLWSALPGRELTGQSLALIDRSDQWMPWSVDPARTLVALIGLATPLAMLVSVDDAHGIRQSIFKWIAGLGIVNMLVGTVQLASGRQLLNWYDGGNPAHLYGTFANHNSAGLFLVISLCALQGVRTAPTTSHRVIKALLGALLAAGVFLTQSRSSIALLIIPAVQLLLPYLQRNGGSPRAFSTALVSILFTLGTLCALTIGNSRAGEILQRFDDLQDARPLIWEDSMVAIARYWPVGSGIGTFDEVFQVDESLENVNSHLAGRAHNEYLEMLLEGGIFAGFLGLSWVIYIAISSIKSVNDSYSLLSPPTSIIIAVLMQSLLDYPLRNQAIMCVVAAMIALLTSAGERIRKQ